MIDFSQYQGPSPEWEEYVLHNEMPAGGLPPGLTPEKLRTETNAMRLMASEMDLNISGLRDKVIWQDYNIPTRDQQTIPARVYKPKGTPNETLLPVYLFFHGGGYLFGSLDTEDATCARIVSASPSPGVAVINVNYRHTPEFQHPTQLNDAWDSFEWLGSHATALGCDPDRIVVGGISAGAGLAAAIALRHHGNSQSGLASPNLTIKGQLLCVPWLIHPDAHPFSGCEKSSVKQNAHAPVLPMCLLRLFTDLLGGQSRTDPYVNVALAADKAVTGLPKTSFLIAGRDIFRDEGLLYAEKLKRNGVPIKVQVFPGLPHAFRRYGDLPSSETWDRLIVDSIQWCLSNDMKIYPVVEAGAVEG